MDGVKQMTTTEGNKLIAEFMGGIPAKHPFGMGNMGYKFPVIIGAGGTVGGDWFSYDALKFHTSWDWLMPVVEKIESMNDGNVTIYYKRCEILYEYDEDTGVYNYGYKGKTKIDAVYGAVTHFIQWYNENK